MNKIREFRKKSGLTMKELGQIVGVAESTISLYETGKHQPDIEILTQIADFFGTTIDSLVGRSTDFVQVDSQPDNEIGSRIRDLRKELCYSQDQLANLTHLSRITIARYEAGNVEPGARALAKLADALGVTTDFLVGRDDNTEPSDRRFPNQIRYRFQNDPYFRLLISAAEKASPVHLKAAIAMLKVLEQNNND